MAILWMLHELLTIFMFWNLPALHLQEQLERIEADTENTQPVNMSDSQPAVVDAEIVSGDCAVNPAVSLMPQEPVHVTPSTAPATVHRTSSPAEHQRDVSDTSSVTMSNEFIEEAEEFMHAERDNSVVITRQSPIVDAEIAQHLSWPCVTVSPIVRTNSDSFLQCQQQSHGSVKCDNIGENILPTTGGESADGKTDASGVSTVRDAEISHILHEISSTAAAEPELPSNAIMWRYYYHG